MDEILRRVKYSIGYPVVTVELPDEEIQNIIKDSMKSMNKYSNEISAGTVSIEKGNSIDLKNHPEIYRVLRVLEPRDTSPFGATNNVMGSDIAFSRSGVRSVSIFGGCTCRFDSGQMAMLYKTAEKFNSSMQDDIEFAEYNSIIYIPDRTGDVTLVYIPKWDPGKIENISDEMIDLIVKHASCKLKMLLGKARKRYTSNKALFEMDYDIYSEGEEELNNLMEELKSLEISLAESV